MWRNECHFHRFIIIDDLGHKATQIEDGSAILVCARGSSSPPHSRLLNTKFHNRCSLMSKNMFGMSSTMFCCWHGRYGNQQFSHGSPSDRVVTKLRYFLKCDTYRRNHQHTTYSALKLRVTGSKTCCCQTTSLTTNSLLLIKWLGSRRACSCYVTNRE